MRQSSLNALVPPSRQKVLATLFMEPERSWYRSELAKHLGVSPSSLQEPLAALTAAGLLRARQDGNRLYYHANREHPLFPEIHRMLEKTVGLLDVLKEVLAPHASKIKFAFVYGSVARAEETSGSDVDIMVVGDAKLSEVTPALRAAQERLGREVNATIYSLPEFQRKLRAKHHFLTSVLDKPKLFIVGSEDDLGSTSHEGADRSGANE